MNDYYKKHHIQSTAHQDPKAHYWTWKAFVTNDSDPASVYELNGLGEKHASKEQAEQAALPVVKIWIDHGKPKLSN